MQASNRSVNKYGKHLSIGKKVVSEETDQVNDANMTSPRDDISNSSSAIELSS